MMEKTIHGQRFLAVRLSIRFQPQGGKQIKQLNRIAAGIMDSSVKEVSEMRGAFRA